MDKDCSQILLASVRNMERYLQEWCSKQGLCPHCQQGKKEEEWMDQRQVMAYLGISRSNFYERKAEGVLVPAKIGSKDFFRKSDLIEALEDSIRKGRI